MSDDKKTDEDFLREHLENNSNQQGATPIYNTTASQSSNQSGMGVSRSSELKYLSFDVLDFPCGKFYPPGTTFMIRAAEVKEIQAYSMVDDNNIHDIIEKMNDMLVHCVRVKYANNEFGTYLDVRDPDRFFLIFSIRELTFQKGNNLVSKANCDCGEEVSIDLLRKNFTFHETKEELRDYFSGAEGCFVFNLSNGETYKLAPPKIGLQKAFTEYILKQSAAKKKINLSFLKIIPFLLYDRKSITEDGINKKLEEYNNMSNDTFQFLNEAVGMITYGISGLVSKCGCGMEVHSEMIFPNGASGIFVISGAFDKFIKK
jgi:hypothetical protein